MFANKLGRDLLGARMPRGLFKVIVIRKLGFPISSNEDERPRCCRMARYREDNASGFQVLTSHMWTMIELLPQDEVNALGVVALEHECGID
jgi:hypothetical protein